MSSSLVASPRKGHAPLCDGDAVAPPSTDADDGEGGEGRDEGRGAHRDLLRLQSQLALVVETPREHTTIYRQSQILSNTHNTAVSLLET